MTNLRTRVLELVPWAAAALLTTLLVLAWIQRFGYPYDLEWMEGGMLAHAWRLAEGLPLYVAPNPDFIPFVYPPGYSALVAAVGKVVGLSLPVGRAVSLCGIAAAALALAWGVWRHTGQASFGVFASVCFLGAWPASGAFYDLVRPDALAIGLLAWALVLSVERWRGATDAAALLLVGAFLCKHNTAAFGVPIALTLWHRDGWRRAVRFGLMAALPALAFVALLQVRSEGHFLTYLVSVPASHPSVNSRIFPGLTRELGNALPVAVAVVALWLVLEKVRGRWSDAVLVAMPIMLGVLFGWWMHATPPLGPRAGPVSEGIGGMALAMAAVAAMLTVVQRGRQPIPWRWVWCVTLACTALAVSGVMRAHNGGYLNVWIPLHWVVCLGFGLVLGRMRARGLVLIPAVLATAQLLWAAGMLDSDKLTPSVEDLEAGDAFVDTLKGIDGPVLSPFASWLPVQAGKAPSVHMIAVWDLNYPGGPYENDVLAVKDAIRNQYWGSAVQANQAFTFRMVDAYEPSRTIAADKNAFHPKSGWRAKPIRVLVPK